MRERWQLLQQAAIRWRWQFLRCGSYSLQRCFYILSMPRTRRQLALAPGGKQLKAMAIAWSCWKAINSCRIELGLIFGNMARSIGFHLG